MTEPKTVLTFEQTTEYNNGYEILQLRIREAWEHDVQEYISKVVEPGYYGEPEVGQRVQSHLKVLAENGVETYYDEYSGHLMIRLRFQLFERDEDGTRWCRPEFEHLGSEFTQIERATKLLRRLGKFVESARARSESKKRGFKVSRADVRNDTFRSPEELVEALRRIKAVEVRTVKLGESSTYKVPTAA